LKNVPANLICTPARPVLFFAFYFHPAITSGVQRASRFYRYLPEFGYQPEVVCSSKSGQDTLQHVHWVPDPAAPQPAKWGVQAAKRLHRISPYNEEWHWVVHAVASGVALAHQLRPAALLSTSPPVGSHLAAWMVHRRTGIPWIADFRDPILDNPARTRAWARPYDRWLERLILRHAARVTGVTDVITAELRRRHPRRAHKILLLWNGFDPDEVSHENGQPPEGRHILLHAGVLYRLRYPWVLLRSLERLVDNGRLDPRRFCFRVLGPVEDLASFLANPTVARLAALGCFEADGQNVPREEARRQTAAAHSLLLIDIVNQTQRGYTVPAKIFDYVLTGRPLLAITDPDSPVDRILARCGLSVSLIRHADSPERIDETVATLLSRNEARGVPSAWFHEQFDGRRQAATLARWIDEISTK
jgi:glycosyltransferase involved in cell wall biosynthesis